MKKYLWLDEYLLSKPGVAKDYKAEWDWHRYMVGGKLFAALMRPSDKYDPAYAEKDLITSSATPCWRSFCATNTLRCCPAFTPTNAPGTR